MTIFDLVFLALALVSIVVIVTALIMAVVGRWRRGLAVLRTWAIATVIYIGVGLVVSAASPQRIVRVGDPWCFDDWCLTVRGVETSRTADASVYTLPLEISSRARRITQRALGAWVYLIDDRGRRYPADEDSASAAVPLDVALGPGESVATARRFRVPRGVAVRGLVTGHGGPYCGIMNFVVIGDAGCLFHKPAMIGLR